MGKISKLIAVINKSVLDRVGKVSHIRVSSYFILGGILTSCFLLMSIDLVNGIVMWSQGNIYSIPAEHIVLFGMILTHHLVLLGLKKSNDESKA